MSSILFNMDGIIPSRGGLPAASCTKGSARPALAHSLSPNAKSNVEKTSVPGILAMGKNRETKVRILMTSFGGSISAVELKAIQARNMRDALLWKGRSKPQQSRIETHATP
mmetsp:Transcript_45115/g.109161  ORF Transcript_45115/g.109161 Transcript_45115/m.109161 type:complete len:111 (-) Transcript_45115:578-910(-)